MSKEIAQTVGGRRMVWLIAILAAFAALAMVASPWKSATASHDADVHIEKSVAPETVAVGESATYTIEVTNEAGSLFASTAFITDRLPGGAFASVSVDPESPFTCDDPVYDPVEDEIVIECLNTLGGMGAGATANIDIHVTAGVAGNHTNDADGYVWYESAIPWSESCPESQESGVCHFIASASATLNVVSTGISGIVHLDPWGNIMDERDDENNLVGYRHVVCLLDGDGALTVTDPETGFAIHNFQGVVETLAAASGGAGDLWWRIQTLSGPVTVSGQELDGDCVSWYSEGPGEQNVTLINGLGVVVADFSGTTGPFNQPLIKEWNLLEPTIITERGETSPNLDGTTIEAPVFFNPVTNQYEAFGPVELDEHVLGSHQSIGGVVGPILVDGALVTFTVSGTCGVAIIDPNADSTVELTTEVIGVGESVTVTSAGVPIQFDVDTAGCASLTTSHTIVTITVAYPTEIGSIPYPVPPAETIRVNWVSHPDVKQVWLAWAGQRIAVTADWTLPNGVCPFNDLDAILAVEFQKTSGGGAFNPSPGVITLLSGGLGAIAFYDSDECGATAIFEYEDEGQVDLDAHIVFGGFIGNGFQIGGVASSKKPFVIYYMKIEDVQVSLVDRVSKGSHNSSTHSGALRDWTPGNPWNEADDVLHADWNVSADLLVRARVRGWFTTSNPSGRPAAGSFGENPRPADRWIMPDDWGLLLAGTNNSAAAFELRPEYDAMWAPFRSQASGLVGDGHLDKWDAPMPPAPVTFDIRGSGFIKEVLKDEVYHNKVVPADSKGLTRPIETYDASIPAHPILPANNYFWNSNVDGLYPFWAAVLIGQNTAGSAGNSMSGIDALELNQIRAVYGDDSIARRLTVYSDNHGEAMVAANGDLNLSYAECATNVYAGGKHCDVGDLVGESDLWATADYPDFRGKHPPIVSNVATVDWLWGGYKTVTIEAGEAPQFKYVVFRALDRDGFCSVPSGSVSLHPVLTSADQAVIDIVNAGPGSHPGSAGVGAGAQLELINFLIDAKEGGIIIDTSAGTGPIAVTQETALGLPTFVATQSSKFPPLAGGAEECQAWVRLSNSLLGVTDVLVVAHNDEGTLGWDNIVNFTNEHVYTLTARWSLETWVGANNIPVVDALKGQGLNAGGDDIFDEVTAIYGWVAATQSWLAYFPAGEGVPGVNTLNTLQTGHAYWIAIKGAPGHTIPWKVMTSVN